MSDDGQSRPTPILASDAERAGSIALLRLAVGEGRLTLEEFSERVGLAYAARTDRELASLARDLARQRCHVSHTGRHLRKAPGFVLASGPQRTGVAAAPVLVALDLRHDRP
jgi:hypothetical protein